MYEKDGRKISAMQAEYAAEGKGLSLEDWLSETGFAPVAGKTTVPEDTTPPTGPGLATPAGESRLGITLLESPVASAPKINEYVTAEDLKGSEEKVSKMLNEKLSGLGLYVTEGTGMYSWDAVNIRKRDEKRNYSPYGAIQTVRTGVEFGPELSEEELSEKAAEINLKIEELKNDNYLTEAQERSGAKYDEYKAATTPEPLSEKEALNLYEKEREEKFSNIRRFRDNKGFDVSFENGDFESIEEEEQYKKYLAGSYITPPNKEQLTAWEKARNEGYTSKQSLKFANNLDRQTRLDLEAIAANEKAIAEERVGALNEKYESQSAAYEESYNAFESNPTEETRLVALADFENLQQTLLEGRELAKDSKGLPLAIKDFGANYNRLQQLTSNFKGLAADANYLTAQLGQLLGDDPKYKEAAFQMAAGIKEEQQKFQRSVKVDEIGSLQEAGMWLMSSGTSLIPSFAMAFTGPAALPLFFATGAGSTGVETAIAERDAAKRMLSNRELLDGNPNMDALERSAIEEQMQQDSKTLNITEWRKITAQIWNGLAEVAFEKTGTLFLLKSLKQGAKLLPPETIKQSAIKLGKDVAKGIRVEGGSEWATNTFQNFADIYILDEDKNFFEAITDEKLFEEGLETFAQGALMGGGMSVGGNLGAIKEAYFSELATSKESARLKEIIAKLESLTGVKGLTNAGDGVPLPQQTQEVQALVEELTGEANDIKNNVIARLGVDLTLEDAKAVGDINRQMRKVNADFVKLASNTDLGAAQLKAIEIEYRAKFDKLAEQRENILTNEQLSAENLKESSGNKVVFDAQSGYNLYENRMLNESIVGISEEWNKMRGGKKTEMFNAAKIELEKEVGPGKAITAEAIEDRAFRNFQNLKYAEKIESGAKNVEDYAKANKINVRIETFDGDNASAAFEQRLLDLGYSKEKAAESNEEKGSKLEVEAVNIPGKNGEPDIILINKPMSVKNKRIGVYAHELLHSIARQKFNTTDVTKAGEELLGYLEKNQPDLYAKVKFRIDQSYTETSEDGEVTKDADYYEEAMNAMSDIIADGQAVDKNFLLQARSFVNSWLPASMQLKSDEATYQFIRGFNKQAHFGGKGPALNIKDKTVGDRSDEEAPTAKESRTLTPEQDAGVIDMLSRRAGRIEEAKKVAEKFGVEVQADAVQQRLEAKIREQLSPLIGKIVTNRTKALYDPIAPEQRNNVSRDDFQNSLRTEIEALAFEEFKEGKQDIEKFLVNRAFLRSNNLASRLGIESAETGGIKKDIDTAKGMAAQEETTAKEDKPQYKTLLERKVLDSEVVNSIKEKVKSTVRVMKTRMDESVSKNVTVKPYIAELRKAMGKQADIDLKKAMGGKKDGELRKFLLRNKAAILQNMTTTYLMTAMPNAIQKKVNGVWTSDWKGKKIDRESVSTDSAGRTSGAELVRRLPNASTRLSDADYLSNILDASGAPIRGRKESLAKAIAEELSFDIINEALQDPNSEIRKAYKNRQELLGTELSDAFVQEVARDVERGSVKRSASIRAMSTEQRMAWESKRDEFSKRMVGVDEDYSARSIRNDLKAVYGDTFTAKQYSDLAEDLLKIFKSIKRIDIKELSIAKEDISDILKEIDNEIDFVENVHKMTGASATVADLFRSRAKIAESKEAIVDILKSNNVPAAVAKSFMARTFANSGRIGVFKKDGTIKKDSRQDFFYDVADVQNALVGKGKLYAQEEWDNAETMAASADVKASYLNGKFENSVELQAQDAATANAAWELTSAIVKGLKNYSPDVQAMVIAAMNSGTNTVARVAAPVTHIAEGATSKNTKSYRYEHATPARTILALMFKSYVQGDKSIDMDALKADYKVAIIPLAMDKVVTAAGFAARQAIGYVPGQTPWYKRYYNIFTLGKIQYALKPFAGGELIGEKYAKAYNTKQSFDVNSKQYLKAVKDVKAIETIKASKSIDTSLSKEFNNILERKTGVESFKTFSKVQAQMRGANKGRFKFFVAPNVEDFRGLVNYAFAGKGKQGEADMKWLEDNLMTPYAKGVAAIDGIRQQIKRDFRTAVKAFPQQYRLLNKEIDKSGFTYDQALRAYLWKKAGIKVPGLSQKDAKILDDAIKAFPELIEFGEAMLVVARRDQWMEPGDYWQAGTLLSDLNSMTEKVGRKKYLEEFIANADAIFTEDNLNKIEALYGKPHREAIEDALYSMKNGTNRNAGNNKQVNAWLNWINGSTGAIMFFNRRSALLQMLSFTNFINWSDNNILKAGAAFANQKQYWADWAMIFNSDKLKERRGGLKQDVSSDEIASVANASKNSPQAILAKLLQLGFTPTQIADSMAIATGGATFYRNRVNKYVKEGKTVKQAEEQAFIDFAKKSDEAQQSSDPSMVSQVQRSTLGRLVFAFQNTPLQYTRLMKKAALDLANGRGDWKENVSKIAYYGAIQNFIFSALQSALFAMLPGFDDDEDETLSDAELKKKNAKEEQKIARVLNSMLDTLLKGSGVYGAVFSTVKNLIKEYEKQEEKGFMADHTYTILAALGISPPIGSKARKLYSAIQTKKFDRDEIEARGWAVTADGKLNLGPNWSILGNVLSASINLPLDRVVDELTSIAEAFDTRNKTWQRIALGLGWKTWDVGAIDEEGEAIKEAAKKKRKEAGVEKAKETRSENKRIEQEAYDELTTEEKMELRKEKAIERRRKAAERRKNR
jgi:hypothetical protein